MASFDNLQKHFQQASVSHQFPASSLQGRSLPLPPGWTEHRAPTGHTYYYNTETKTSTYTRPVPPPSLQTSHQVPYKIPVGGQINVQNNVWEAALAAQSVHQHARPHFHQPRPKPQPKPDRAKTKRQIPEAEPWLLVTTKKGLRFVHNPETKESLWVPSENIQQAMDRMTKLSISEERDEERIRRRKKALEKVRDIKPDIVQGPEDEDASTAHDVNPEIPAEEGDDDEEGDYDDQEYYEEEDYDEEHEIKRQRTGEAVEFNEEDIAWQLGAMAQDYGIDEEDMDGEEDMPLQDASVIFKEMLDEYSLNPYSTWENEMPKIVEDSRYTVLTTTKTRKEVFSEWSKSRMAALRLEKENQVKLDPRIPYLRFLEMNATPKLYWPEFKRKFKKEPEMKDPKIVDRDREKYYRDYISRMKISIETRENDLKKLLRSTKGLTRNISDFDLPASIACDIRYISVPQEDRQRILSEHMKTLPESLDDNLNVS